MDKTNTNRRIMLALGIWSTLATVFFVVGGVFFGAWDSGYLVWNLLLALIPVAFGWLWLQAIARGGWNRPIAWLWLAAWLGFLPNSFYVITDVMHIADMETGLPLLFSSVMFWMFGFAGMMSGALSLGMVHQQLLRKWSALTAYVVVEVVLALVSLGMYLGRIERWNTWDIVARPLELASTMIDGFGHPEVSLMLMYFVLLSGFYAGIWSLKAIFKK